jgi:glucose/mannose-6-phosphate isomerase
MTDTEYTGPFIEMPLDHIRRFLRAHDSGVFDGVPVLERKYDHVIVAGMGGSGVVGSAIVDLARNVAKVPVDVLRANRLPAFTSDRTLTIVISYSGNTREMLELYDECVSKGCRMIVITTGG